MNKFKITYTGSDGEERTVIQDFEDSPDITAKEWADDYAYTLADKGHFECSLISVPDNLNSPEPK